MDSGVQCDPALSPPQAIAPAPVTVNSSIQSLPTGNRVSSNTKAVTKTGTSKKSTNRRKKSKTKINLQPTPTPAPLPHFRAIIIRGDSYTRHIAASVRERISSATPVSGMCKPGARLLDIVSPGPTPPESAPSCERLITQHQPPPGDTTARPAGAELVLTPLPHHHDLRPDHPIHEETVLVNAFIEESLTRHGQSLSVTGKRLLAGMIVEYLASPRPSPAGPVRPDKPPRHVVLLRWPLLQPPCPRLLLLQGRRLPANSMLPTRRL
ncbi:hypothetical protein J6590_080933 [Homalodisca vitripennis]|nr:hypothetical protein J6590_080933 [Homalodisca vitripennis]